MTDRVTAKLIPPSIADLRSRSFGEIMAHAVAEPNFQALLFEEIDNVDASVLPYLVRDFGMQDFIEPGLRDSLVRKLLKNAYQLMSLKGNIEGVRRGLMHLGVRVVWKQWFQSLPKGQPGTHTATLFINSPLFEGQTALIDERVQRATLRMIDAMKRWSQHVDFRIGITARTPVGIAAGLAAATVLNRQTRAAPPTGLTGRAGLCAAGQGLQFTRISADASPLRRLPSRIGLVAAMRSIQLVKLGMEARLP